MNGWHQDLSSSQLVKTSTLLLRDHVGCNSRILSSQSVKRFGFPLGRDFTYNFPNASNITDLPSGETWVNFIIFTSTLSGDTLIVGLGGTRVERVSCDVKRNGRHRFTCGIIAADFTARPKDQRGVIGKPVHIGIKPVHGPSFLHILVKVVVYFPCPCPMSCPLSIICFLRAPYAHMPLFCRQVRG